jgi:thymidylate synthase
MRTQADKIYLELLHEILTNGDEVTTRNSDCYSHFNLPNVTFTEFPLVTLRKTAAMTAISEQEWFFSGNGKCPDKLLPWWDGQLSPDGCLYDGYPSQFRDASSWVDGDFEQFDQVAFILEALQNNPNSRRLVMTVWNPGEMAAITETNENPNTPTCCHSIVVQFFVRDGSLHMKTYQRSADMLLGVPHNWVQSWAMLMYFAAQSNLKVGSMTWMWGDAHIYQEESHLETVRQLLELKDTLLIDQEVELFYEPSREEFLASDFMLVGTVPSPLVTIRPKLL